MNSSSGWFNASNEDGNLYARAEALGASAVVLATRERTVTYLATKDSASSGKYPHCYCHVSLYHPYVFNSHIFIVSSLHLLLFPNDFTLFMLIILIYLYLLLYQIFLIACD